MKVVNWGSQPPAVWRPGNETVLHAAGSTGTERICVGEQWFEPGVGAPLHFHPDGIEEVISVLSGAMDFKIGDEQATLGTGQAVIIPADLVHGFVAVGEERLHIWGAFSSASPGTVFIEHRDELVEIGGVTGDAIDDTRTRREV